MPRPQTTWMLLLAAVLSCAGPREAVPGRSGSAAGSGAPSTRVVSVPPRPAESPRSPRSPRPFARLPEESYFLEIALGSEYGLGDFTIKRWAEDVRVEVVGYPTAEDLATLREVLAELNELVGREVRVYPVPSDGNLRVHFIPHDDFYRYEPSGVVFFGGFFWNWWNAAGEIVRGRVVIGSDRLTASQRKHLIREEITQVMGLMNDSEKYPESIFYQGYSETHTYAPLDRLLIRMLYSDALRPGMTLMDLDRVLPELYRTAFH